jgi:hypothetical protein
MMRFLFRLAGISVLSQEEIDQLIADSFAVENARANGGNRAYQEETP